MVRTPSMAAALVEAIRGSVTRPTLTRLVTLVTGLIVTMGRHSVSRVLRVVQPRLRGHWSNYHRLFSSARISMWKLAAALTRRVIALLPADAPIILAADDTVDGKDGDRVWAKGPHRDGARSSHGHTAVKWGHRWLVVGVLARVRGMTRTWALPVLCGLCLSPRTAKLLGRPPKTPGQLARQMVMRLMRWLPARKFILLGDSLVVTHQTAHFALLHADRLTAIGRLRGDANFYAPPKYPGRPGRDGTRAKKGKKLPSPAERIDQMKPHCEEVAWYGGQRRQVRYVTDTALWHDRHHSQTTPIRWVAVLGDAATGRPHAYFFSTDTALAATRIIELYAARWNIEVTFEESRAYLGVETTRHWCRQSVLRVTPLLLCLYSVVALLWHELPRAERTPRWSRTPCYDKQTLTFTDALFAVRRELWRTSLLRHRSKNGCLTHLPRSARDQLLWHLAAAA